MAAAIPSIPLPNLPTLAFGGGSSTLPPPSNSNNNNTPPSQTAEAIKDIVFGSLAGSIGKVIEYPFDTVKVRLQSQSLSQPLYTGPLDCFRQSIRRDGVVRGLYRGISAPLVGAAIETSSLFFSYRIAQDMLMRTPMYMDVENRKALPLSALVVCGAASGAFTSVLLTPIELVKCQMQVPLEAGSTRGPGPLAIIAKIFRHHGIGGFWHGQLGTLIRETGGSAAWFGSYEGTSAVFKKLNAKKEQQDDSATSISVTTPFAGQPPPPLPIWQQLIAGAMAGMMYNFVFFPADTIKSRMQTEDFGVDNRIGAPQQPTKPANMSTHKPGGAYASAVIDASTRPSVLARQTFWIAGKALWQQQGLRGMYRGCGITVARSAPSSAFIFAIYEGLRGWWS